MVLERQRETREMIFRSRVSLRRATGAVCLAAALLFALSSCRSGGGERDVERVDSVLAETGNRLFSQPAKCDSAYIALQRETRDSVAWYRIALHRATAHMRLGDSVQAARLYESVRLFCEREPGTEHLLGEYHNHKGVEANLQADVELGMRHFREAERLLDVPPRKRALIPVVCNLANYYAMAGKLPLSAQYYRKALFLCDSLNETRERCAVFTGLARVYMDMENFLESESCLSRAAKGMGSEDAHTRFYYHVTLGNCLYFQGQYAEALAAFFKGRELAEGFKSRLSYVLCEVNIGETLLMQDSVQAAARHIDYCTRYLAAHPSEFDAPSAFYIRSLSAALAVAQGNMSEARRFLAQNDSAPKGVTPRYLMLHYARLQRYAARAGDWKKAYALQSEAGRYADSLHSIQNINAVSEMELRYRRDSTLSRQRIALAESEARAARKDVYLVGVALAAVVIVAVGVALLFAYRQRTQRKLRSQMEKMTELRMDIVRNRVSPHYVFNVLNTVLPKLRNYSEVAFPLELLIDVLRGNLLSSGNVETTLSAELRLVRDFVRLHQCCRGGYPRVEWHIGEGLEQSGERIPAMVIEIPVENALKHAFPQLTAECRVDVNVSRDADGSLRVEVRDNGTGYNPGAVRPTGRDTGTGLRLISRTIAILNQYNRRPASFSIASLPAPQHGTAVSLVLPPGYLYEIPAYRGGVEA